MSLNDPSISKQMRIQIWREEVAASASLCTCPPTSPAASQSSTNISLSASSSSSSAGGSGLGDAFSFPRGDILPSQPTYCPTCSRLGAPSAMGLEPSSAYLDEIQHSGGLLGGGTFGDRRGSLMLFRTKHGNHAIFRGMRNFVRRISGSSSGGGGGKNGPLPPRAADEATSMYRRATVAHLSGANKAAAAIAEAEAEAEAAAMDDVESGDVIGEKQARLRRAQRLLVRSHRN
ncbi:hypothetical protein K4K49_010466 [Colletotrichum sp. SAR 10_70]|nr:hypothetical protein K4K50_000772 [Colletotrichum sp. SAR 10_71]KAI8186916.1 hypothetical protein K4K51_009726 [Colletotrichum sp. SAR 10_75]KAI8193765.1 hypothetical protein K4K49_010466 [Colletotrichum sp. SAR 10_70]KAI8208879.1 hypothetical protein K4K52_000896 [Colletotrichum sp. SAR 10_76]